MKSRRNFLKFGVSSVLYSSVYAFICADTLTLVGCFFKKKEGPVDVHWDRDACHRCGMILSDRKYAAQIRGGEKNESFLFDDFGCAVLWLNEQKWASSPKEFWIADSQKTGAWIAAEKAFYVSGKTTPMGYGYAAVTMETKTMEPNTMEPKTMGPKTMEPMVSYEEARKALLLKK